MRILHMKLSCELRRKSLSGLATKSRNFLLTIEMVFHPRTHTRPHTNKHKKQNKPNPEPVEVTTRGCQPYVSPFEAKRRMAQVVSACLMQATTLAALAGWPMNSKIHELPRLPVAINGFQVGLSVAASTGCLW